MLLLLLLGGRLLVLELLLLMRRRRRLEPLGVVLLRGAESRARRLLCPRVLNR